MNCPRCKTVVTQQDKYCPSCGLPLEAARAGGAAPKKPAGKSKAYEEASTQLVDVDEFRKYMADEKSKGGAPAGPAAGPAAAGGSMAASASLARGGNLAGAPAAGRNLAGEAEENPDLVSTQMATPVRPPVPRPGPVAPAPVRSPATEVDSFNVPPKNNSMIIIGGVVLVVILLGLAYMFMR